MEHSKLVLQIYPDGFILACSDIVSDTDVLSIKGINRFLSANNLNANQMADMLINNINVTFDLARKIIA